MNTKKLLALLLALVMCLSMLPVGVFADEDLPADEPVAEEAAEAPAAEPEVTEEAEEPSEEPAEPAEEPAEEVEVPADEAEEPAEEPADEEEAEEEAAEAEEELLDAGLLSPDFIPDPAFRQALQDIYGYNQYTPLTKDTAANLKSLNLPGYGIRSLQGIEWFTGLTYLDVSDNSLTALNLSPLNSLQWVYCSGNQLTSLTLNTNNVLTKLDCDHNNLSALNLSACTALRELNCSYNALTSLDTNACTSLVSLDCSHNRLTSLNAGACTALESLDCSYNCLTEVNASPEAPLSSLITDMQSFALSATAWVNEDIMIIPSADFGDWALDEEFAEYCYDGSNFVFCPLVEEDYLVVGRMGSIAGTPCPFTALLSLNKQPLEVSFTQDYVMMDAGSEAQLAVSCNVPGLVDELLSNDFLWILYEDSFRLGSTPLSIVAPASGSDYPFEVDLYLFGQLLSVLRVDVVVDEPLSENIVSVDLLTPSAKVDLFSTAYAEVSILPVLLQNLPENHGPLSAPADLVELDPVEATGVSVVAARFTDAKANEFFTLVPKDDRTLMVVPTNSTLVTGADTPKNVPSKFVSTIEVLLADSAEYTPVTGKLTLTVTKTLPKVTANAVKLNTAIPGISAPFTFKSPSPVTAIEVLGTAPAGFVVDEAGMTVAPDAGVKKASGKLQLMVTMAESAIKVPVTVSLSAAATAPKIKLSTSSVTIVAEIASHAELTVTLPQELAGFDVELARYTFEGDTYQSPNTPSDDPAHDSNTDPLRLTFIPTDDPCVVVVSVESGSMCVANKSSKVVLSCGGNEFSFTVKTVAAGKINASFTAAGYVSTVDPDANVILTAKRTGYTGSLADPMDERLYVESITAVKKGEADKDVTAAFVCMPVGNTAFLSLQDDSVIPAGSQLYANLMYHVPGIGDLRKAVKLTLKTVKAPTPALSFKLSGKVDVLTGAGSVTITGESLKNIPYSMLDCAVAYSVTKVYDGVSRQKVDEPTEVFFIDGNTISLGARYNLSAKDKFAVTMHLVDTETGDIVLSSKPVSLPVTAPKLKFTSSASTVQLLRKDYNQLGTFTISCPGVNPMDVDTESIVNDFNARYNGRYRFWCDDSTGLYALYGPYDNTAYAKLPSSATVKINIYLKGYDTIVGTVSIKVTAK